MFLEFSFVSLLAVTFTSIYDEYIIELMDDEIHTKMSAHSQVPLRTFFFYPFFASPIVIVTRVVSYMQVYICVYIYTRMINKTLYMYNCSVCICMYVRVSFDKNRKLLSFAWWTVFLAFSPSFVISHRLCYYFCLIRINKF